jgi:hypothetical protein
MASILPTFYVHVYAPVKLLCKKAKRGIMLTCERGINLTGGIIMAIFWELFPSVQISFRSGPNNQGPNFQTLPYFLTIISTNQTLQPEPRGSVRASIKLYHPKTGSKRPIGS